MKWASLSTLKGKMTSSQFSLPLHRDPCIWKLRMVKVFSAFIPNTNPLLTFSIYFAQEGSVIFSRPKLCMEALESTFGRLQLQLIARREMWLGGRRNQRRWARTSIWHPCTLSPFPTFFTSSLVHSFIQQYFCVCVSLISVRCCTKRWRYSGKEESFCLHGAYLLAGKTDNKQTNKLPEIRKMAGRRQGKEA